MLKDIHLRMFMEAFWKHPEESAGEGGGRGIRMGNTCKSMADSCHCMTKTTTIF